MAGDPSSLSARAQEILRRADAQLEALRAPAPAAAEPPPAAEPATGPSEPDASHPGEIQDLGALVDTVQTGVESAAAHLVALSEAVERIAHEIEAANETHRRTLPPGLEGHARFAGDHAAEDPPPGAAGPEDPGPPATEPAPVAATEPVATPEPAPAPVRVPDAAHDAARLVAIEMAVAGDTREGVGRRLREEFGISDPRSILEDAFGPDTGRSHYGA